MRLHLVVALCLVGLLAAGCKKHGPALDIPGYGGAMGMPKGPPIVDDSGTLIHAAWQTPDSLAMVRAYYTEQLVKGRNWHEVGNGLGASFANNMNYEREMGKPEDPAQTGGYVAIYDSDQRTLIDVWEFFPKAAPPAAP